MPVFSAHVSIQWIKAHASLWLLILIALLVLVPRSAYIASVHSECIDDEYHLVRGVRFLTGQLGRTPLNDPTLGEAIMALPLWIADAQPNKNFKFGQILHGQKVPIETLTMTVAIWKSILFVPCVLLAFVWVRRLYNERAAWVAVALLLVEPTISAHIAPAGLDVLGFEAILAGCFCWWRYFEKQTWLRLVVAASVSGAAMLVKHTAIILPMVAVIYAMAWWVRRWRDLRYTNAPKPGDAIGVASSREDLSDGLLTGGAQPTRELLSDRPPALSPDYRGNGTRKSLGWMLRRDLIHAFCAIVIAFITLHFLSGGSVQTRRPDSIEATSTLGKLFEYPLPAGNYIASLQTAIHHGGEGHPSWFLGARNDEGCWYYYPVVAFYKVPIALMVFVAVGLFSLWKAPPTFGEIALVVPMLLLFVLITSGGINIGFRHAIPSYALLLMLCCRSMSLDLKWLNRTVFALLAVTTLDTARYFPNLISYINFPRDKVWMDVNDSNIDWGQGLKQIRIWCDENWKSYGGRGIYVRYFGLDYSPHVEHYLDETHVTKIERNAGPPDHGILIISPVYVAGLFERGGRYKFLRTEEPIAIIGDSNLVFDLDEIYARRPEVKPTGIAPTTEPVTLPTDTEAE